MTAMAASDSFLSVFVSAPDPKRLRMRPRASSHASKANDVASTAASLRACRSVNSLASRSWVTCRLWLISQLVPLYHCMMNRKDTVKSRPSAVPDFMQTVEVLASFRKGLRQFLSFSESMVGAVGITSQQYQALLILINSRHEGVTIGSLAKEMLLVPHGAVQLVNRLSEVGLAERRADDRDARVSRVHATPKALQLMRALVKAHAGELGAQERLLRESLNGLRALIRPESVR
jgi:DNA-binding MarR family transcriptional regulator